jgi:glycosyltransferase involved in cell wall biosynthesis
MLGLMGPIVSVCVPAYRSAPYIASAIESVLAQTLDDIELIIVDDASDDSTAEIVERYSDTRIRFERNHETLGVAGNWNRATGLARGRYVKVLCHDDVLAPSCLEWQIGAMEKHPEVALVAGKRDIVDSSGRVLVKGRGLRGLKGVVPGREAIRRTLRAGTNIFGEPLAVLLRRDLMAKCGAFSDATPYMIDLEYWCRMLRFGPLFAQDCTVGKFRVIDSSLSAHLIREQRRQAVALFRTLRQEDSSLAWIDYSIGSARSAALAGARAVVYRLLGTQPSRAGQAADAFSPAA